MRPKPQWYRVASSRLVRERSILAGLPYFAMERAFFDQEYFSAIGNQHYFGQRSGRQYSLRIRLRYPRTFPRSVPRVFDHDKAFTPSANGHLFATHELCLTLPERKEFATTRNI
jgi:hypothetical protein